MCCVSFFVRLSVGFAHVRVRVCACILVLAFVEIVGCSCTVRVWICVLAERLSEWMFTPVRECRVRCVCVYCAPVAVCRGGTIL